ncbi:MAG: hypothetical protein U0T02_02865 [Solirubrobacteraceae bacterium]
MSVLSRRLLEAFVEPAHAGGTAPRPVPSRALPAATVAVLGSPEAVAATAAATALLLAVRGPGLLAIVGATAPARLPSPPTPAAARAAARLRDRGHDALAAGRLVRLAAEPVEVPRAAAVLGGPCVTAAAAPRDTVLDRLLGAQDAVLVVAGESSIGLVAPVLAGLEPLGVPCAAAPVAPDAVSASLALAGIAVRRRWAAGLRGALGDTR